MPSQSSNVQLSCLFSSAFSQGLKDLRKAKRVETCHILKGKVPHRAWTAKVKECFLAPIRWQYLGEWTKWVPTLSDLVGQLDILRERWSHREHRIIALEGIPWRSSSPKPSAQGRSLIPFQSIVVYFDLHSYFISYSAAFDRLDHFPPLFLWRQMQRMN